MATRHFLVAMAMGALVFTASAQVTQFPETGGDISTSSGWGLPDVPTGIAGFTLGASYWASADVTFAGMQFSGAAGAKSTFDLGSSTVTLNGNTDKDIEFRNSNLTVTLQDGTVSVGKGMRLSVGDTCAHNTLVLDGCIYSQPNLTFNVGYGGSSGNAVILTNGAQLTLKDINVSDNGGHGNRLEINEGCVVKSRYIYLDSYGTRTDNDNSTLLIRGTGTRLETTGSADKVYIGFRHDHDTVTVTDGAVLNVTGNGSIQFGGNSASGSSRCAYGALNVLNGASASAYTLYMGLDSTVNAVLVSNATLTVDYVSSIGNKADCGTNRIVVTGPTGLFTATRLRLGQGANADCNSVRVEQGAKLTSMSDTVVGETGSFNEVVVSNATLQVQGLAIGAVSGAEHNAIRIQGPSAVFTQTRNSWRNSGKGYFGAGGNGLLEFSDHCTVTSPHPEPVIGDRSNGNVVRITGGAKVTSSNPIIGQAPTASVAATSGNRIEVLDGAEYTLTRPYIKGVGNGIVISNATLTSSNSQTNTILVGVADASVGELAEATSNNYVRLEGAAPKLRLVSSAGYRFWNCSRLEFVLPTQPYAEAPLAGCQLQMDATSDLVIDLASVDAIRHGKLHFELMEISNVDQRDLLDESVLLRANARLESSRATVGWVNNRLVCTVKSNLGLIMVVH